MARVQVSLRIPGTAPMPELIQLIQGVEATGRRKLLKEKLSELKHASGGAWEDVRTGATRAWDELRPALQSAISKFK